MRDLPLDRATTETIGVAVLVLVTIVATASVGLSVTLLSEEEGSDTTFNFDYQESIKSMLISYTEGDELVAGDIVIEGPEGQVTWAEEGDMDSDARIQAGPPGNIAIVISANSEYGAEIGEQDTLEIRYTPETEDGEEAETVVLASWNGGNSGGESGEGDDGFVDGPQGEDQDQGQG